jgi:hypothetical protein
MTGSVFLEGVQTFLCFLLFSPDLYKILCRNACNNLLRGCGFPEDWQSEAMLYLRGRK